MKRIHLFASVLALILSPAAHADVLAVTHADFSTAAQGTNGLQYGYYSESRTTTGTFSVAGIAVNGGLWSGAEASSTPWNSATDAHPSGNTLRSSVRRYTIGDGTGSEPSYTGAVRIVGRFFRLQNGVTERFVTVNGTTSFATGDTTGGNAFDFTASGIAPGSTIDFGVSAGSVNDTTNASYDRTGLAAWIVTGDTAVPTHLVANDYHSVPLTGTTVTPDLRGLAFSMVTDGVIGATDETCFDTSPGAAYQPNQFAGLLYSEPAGSGKATRFDQVRIDMGTAFSDGGDFAALPRLYLLRHNSDPQSSNPAFDERYALIDLRPVQTTNAAGRPAFTFDLTGLSATQRTAYGFAIVGPGSGSNRFISVAELSATATRVADTGMIIAEPFWVEYNGHRYALSFTRGTWEQCEAEAVSYGGHLVSINSAAENDWVFDTLGRSDSIYIGLRQNPLQANVEPNGGWTWMDGTVLSAINGTYVPGVYKNWNDASVGGSEPNHSGGAGEDYACYYPSGFGGRSTWGDIKNAGYPETSTYRGIIELPSLGSPSTVRPYQISVSGKANVFEAGQAGATPSAGGVAPPFIAITPSEKVTLSAASGSIHTGAEAAGPDGAHHPTYRCDINGVAGVSGYVNRNNSAHLVGVFVGDTPLGTTPSRLDFSADAIGEDFVVIGPQLGQVFFIGDGLTPDGEVQEFLPPAGATKLYLGIPDANGNANNYIYTGPPNGYSDNSGYYNIRLQVQPNLTPRITNAAFPINGGTLQILGGTGPYVVTLQSGALPAGLELVSPSGTFAGTAANGAYTFTLRITDSLGHTNDQTFTGEVANPVPAPKGLVAWWPAQNTVAEIIGGVHAAAPDNNPQYTTGRVGRAFSFNGTSQSLQTASTDVMKHLPLTIEGWIKPEARTSGNLVSYLPTNVIANDQVNFGGHGFGAHLYPDGSMLRVGIEGAAEDFRTVPGVTFTDNTWVHVAVVYTEGNVKTYLNGALQDNYSFTQGALNGGTTVRIGRHNDDTGYGSLRFFKGAIDELSLYHAGLSAAQVDALFKAGAGGKERYDAGLQFVIAAAQNTGSAWSYGAIPNGSINTNAFQLFTSPTTDGTEFGWHEAALTHVSINPTDNVYNPVGYSISSMPRQVTQHPGNNLNRSVLRWTAPASGRYAVSGSFTGANSYPTSTDVHVYHKTSPLAVANGGGSADAFINSYLGNGQSFTGVIDAAKDDTVDFIVGPNGSYDYDSTGTFASITRVGNIIPTVGNGIASWGQGANGALGNGGKLTELSPVRVDMEGALYNKSISAVAGGRSHSLALDTTGKVYSWGLNSSGQLGDGSTNEDWNPDEVTTSGALSGKTVTRIAACDGISFAVTSDGQLVTWGKTQPASFTVTPTKQTTPVRVMGSLATKSVVAVACGTLHSLALTADGEIHAWGINHAGQLGSGTTTGRDVPAKMTTTGTALSGKTVTAIAIVGASSFALTSEGKVYAWGLNDFGQLGDGSTANRSLPVLIGGLLSGKTITAICSGSGRHQLALASDGSVFAWGDNASGQLGNGTTTSSTSPVAVTMSGALAGVTVANVYAGAEYSMARTTEGELFTWGADAEGQLGDGVTAGPSLEPKAVDDTTSLGGQFVVAASAGSTHALAVTSGIAVQELVVRDPSNADIADGGTFSFGNQAVGTPAAPRVFTLRNVGAAPLTISSITLSGDHAADFGLNASTAIDTINPGDSRTFSVTFKAAALGARNALITINSDDSDEAIFDLNLTGAGATDSTPPTLDVLQSWVEKVGTPHAFKLLIDARDNVGVDKIQYRSKINSTVALPDTTPWLNWTWRRDEPVDIRFACSSIVIELRALDAAGNASPIQRRIFKTPFPLNTAPNLTPKFVSDSVFTGATIDCRGLFVTDFDGDGRDDILQIDRLTGLVKVRKLQANGSYVSNGFSVTANAVSDSAIGDFDADGKPDIALVLNNALVVYHNDGPDGVGTLQFSVMAVPGLATTGISSVVGVTTGDITGEGKPDIVISGTGDDGAMGTVAKIAVILNDGQFQLTASNNAFSYPTSTAGPVRIGDVTGDGWNDVVTIDAANKQVLLFINKRNGSLGGAIESDPAARPQATITAASEGGLPANALAVGDVTGDGRADVVVTVHAFGALDGAGTERDHLLWQLLDSRGAAPLNANPFRRLSQGDLAASPTSFRSDVILQDLNGDRFPEAIFTNPFELGTPMGGVRAVRITCQLDSSNVLSSFSTAAFGYPTGAPDPHRLAAGRFQSTRPDILLASGGSEPVQWIFSTYTELNKTYDLATTAFTERDSTGTVDTNGLRVYETDIGGLVSYSISYVNNATTAITGGIVECVMPSTLSVESGDAGYTLGLTGSSKYIRWTQDIPAGSSGVRRFTARVGSGATADAAIIPTANMKKGTTVLVTKPMPKVVLRNPLELTVTAISDTDPKNGFTARLDEYITYRMKVKNRGTGPITGFSLGMNIPANTTLISGTSPPAPVLVGTLPNYISATWTNLTLAGGADFTYDLRVQVKSTVPNGTKITNNTITLTRPLGQKAVASAITTTILPSLEITLRSNKNIVRPGETMLYIFTVRNLRSTQITNAKVVDLLPSGVSLLTAGVNDNQDAPDGKGNFVYSAGTWTAAQLDTSTHPAFDRSTGILTWSLGTVPAGAMRDLEFEVIVKQDIPTFYNTNGVSVTQEIQNKSYNFVATTSTGTRIFAAAAVGGAAANVLTATPGQLLPTALAALPARRSTLTDPPLDAPKMVLVKSALDDGTTFITGETFIAGEKITTVINDPSVTTDGLCDYKLSFANFGVGTAINVMVRDYVPTNMTFAGLIRKNGAPIPSVVGYRFYDAAGKQLTMFSPETFTDSDGNGLYDLGEPYTDSNSNGKYDDITGASLSSVRSIEFPAGDVLSGIGGNFTYRTKTISNPGIYITSDAGGMTGVKDGLTYTKVNGYHLTADNLHFPVNGSPKQLKVLVTGPATFDLPNATKSRTEMVGTEMTQIVIPFALTNPTPLTMAGVKMTVVIPKGYLVVPVVDTSTDPPQQTVPAAWLQDYTTPVANARSGTVTRNASTGITTVTFPINDWQKGDAVFQVQLDPATKSVLKAADGYIKGPLAITATLSGGYLKAGKLTPIASHTNLVASLRVRDTTAVPPPSAPRSVGAAPPPGLADAKIFVGRCAPVSVKRGEAFAVTIFVGNLTNLELGAGIIEMSVPAGCDYVSASLYKYNAPGITPGSDTGGTFGIAPTRVGTKVTWKIGTFAGLEGGAVMLVLKVREDFTGTRIDDNTCTFDVVNACGKTSGPIGIVVREGNESTQSSNITGSAISGMGLTGATPTLAQILGPQVFAGTQVNSSFTPIQTPIGGADILQLINGVTVIPLGGNRVLTVGPGDKIIASAGQWLVQLPYWSVAVGGGSNSGVRLTKLPTFLPSVIQSANTVLANLHNRTTSLVSAHGGNIVAAGGGNLVAAGGGNLVDISLTGPNGPKLIGNDGSTFTLISTLVAPGGATLIGNDGSTLVAAGGLNIVAAGGGNIGVAGAGNLIGNDGSTLVAAGGLNIVAAGGLNLIAQDGGSLVAAGGGNLVAAGGGNIVAAGGLNLIVNPKQ